MGMILSSHIFDSFDDVFGIPRQTIPKHRLLLLERVNEIAPVRISWGFYERKVEGEINIKEIGSYRLHFHQTSHQQKQDQHT